LDGAVAGRRSDGGPGVELGDPNHHRTDSQKVRRSHRRAEEGVVESAGPDIAEGGEAVEERAQLPKGEMGPRGRAIGALNVVVDDRRPPSVPAHAAGEGRGVQGGRHGGGLGGELVVVDRVQEGMADRVDRDGFARSQSRPIGLVNGRQAAARVEDAPMGGPIGLSRVQKRGATGRGEVVPTVPQVQGEGREGQDP
jgi:hypothetical protein